MLDGRSTVTISRKKSKRLCADYLTARLAGWGIEVTFLIDEDPILPAAPDSRVIPMIHYGILGTNSYANYETVYCLNSFYIREDVLNRHLQEFEAEASKYAPFCSERCKLLDLGRWLDGDYRIPGEPADLPEAREGEDDEENGH